jgi:hypothetical protein
MSYTALTAAAREKAKLFISSGGTEYDLQTSDDPLAVDYRALQKQINEEVRAMYRKHWEARGILRHQFLAVPAQLGPVTMRRRQRWS